jgi:hypothetical protein
VFFLDTWFRMLPFLMMVAFEMCSCVLDLEGVCYDGEEC